MLERLPEPEDNANSQTTQELIVSDDGGVPESTYNVPEKKVGDKRLPITALLKQVQDNIRPQPQLM